MTGEEAYGKYATFTGGKTYDGRDMPTWTDLPERIRGAWDAVAQEPTPKHTRVETGSLQIGDDWPGIFIRGDNAAYYAMCLREALETVPEGMTKYQCENLIALLTGCDVRNGEPTQKIERR